MTSMAWRFIWGVNGGDWGTVTKGRRPTHTNGTQEQTCTISGAVEDTKADGIKEERKGLNRNYSQQWGENQVS